MIKNYFKTSFRYFWNHKIFSVINIVGLAIGICVCFFALLYVRFELSRDSYNKQADHIYRLVTDVKTDAGISYESTPAPMGPAIQAAFPGIKAACRIFMDDMIIQSNPDNSRKEEIAYADPSVFKIFTWPLLRGNPEHLFDVPFNVVLSESAAKRYFGSTDVLGQTLILNGKDRATVTGIMKDIPYNSHLRVDMLFSMSTLTNGEGWDHNWTRFGFYTYLLFQPGQGIEKFKAKLPAFVKANYDQGQVKYQLSVEPLKSVYLYGKPRGHRTGASASGSITDVYVVSVIALLVLFIAGFNFINLTTAFSLQRAKEIGVRKVLGASKKQLVFQFFTDALLLCMIAFTVALLITVLLSPLFMQLSGIVFSRNIFANPEYVSGLFFIAIAIGILSGIYPALFLSGFKPISSLKGKFDSAGSGLILRKTLVIAQFSISIFLIVATTVVYRQLDFMQNQQLGFQKDHKLVVDFQFDNRINQQFETVKQRLSNIAGVGTISLSSSIPGTSNNQYKTVIENSKREKQELRTDAYFVDNDFLKQYGIDLIAGEGFSRASAKNPMQTMVINETMAHSLGFSNPEDAIGKYCSQLHHEGTIIGVVRDFHFHSFIEKVQPLSFTISPGNLTLLTLNIIPANAKSTIDKIADEWKKIAPGLPFVYYFADEAYNQQYQSQQRFGQLFICFSSVAIAISCLGLLGLSAFSTSQRKKEIGIRKVLGATVSGIIVMLSKDFIKLIGIALLISPPLAWLALNKWLQGFAYRINIPLWIFLFSGGAAVIIALLTISFQSVKAAIANPVKSLKSD